ncbi:MAG: hypothetical protein GY898_26045 [Proteobacteria bacterium]|nr:hypothetical protein [Pseudomonadota bacterium]
MSLNAATLGDGAMAKMLMLKQTTLVDGVAFDDIRDYARKELLLMGVTPPDTPEEEEMLQQQAQQQQQPDPMMVAAMAEQGKADAAKQKNQIAMAKVQSDAMIQEQQKQIDSFKAQTDRFKVQVDAQVAGANIDYTKAKAMGEKIENISRGANSYRAIM